ncbi:MAG: FIST N-terminal domain-containing protein [Syntrophomonas sp.]|uniref:FIST signal transduction protein n=1 Tax=Syntrophomonas sp. TaxID=2053627 RepID=UPI0026250413|nr:FIST N-terminal domain-containing protein [Syntrophomonas sp.]MDD3878662.1 FIST N-terminal domain-containing protein [Syntrophomonas sp.]MDD4626138.1 FIST N-terminal domain-containing protein [Syntrophomonas sp.]
MRIEQKLWKENVGWSDQIPRVDGLQPQLLLVFGTRKCLQQKVRFDEIKGFYPGAHIFGCSTAGEICGTSVFEDSIVITALEFEHTRIEGRQVPLSQVQNSLQAGKYLASSLTHEDLSHVLLLSDGLHVNGSELLQGLTSSLPPGIAITGGMAGDKISFEETLVFWDAPPAPDTMAVLGFYGKHIRVGCGSMGGFDPFGPQRLITRSAANVLYEMDGRSALELYKKYLGEYADGLPATGVFFPLSISGKQIAGNLVRTILKVNEEDQSLTFGGDVPTGAFARMMKANLDRLIDGAVGAAETSLSAVNGVSPELAILISCFGRRAVLKQRIEEEVEAVSDVLGSGSILTGFYSYGEISPFKPGEKSVFHNQTMTITTLREV